MKRFVFGVSFLFCIATAVCAVKWGGLGLSQQTQALEGLSKESFLEPRLLRWLEDHPNIRMFRSNKYKPINYKDKKGAWKGVSQDYMTVVSDVLEVSFDEHKRHPLKSKYKSLTDRECDISVASSDIKRNQAILSTKPYLSFRLMIFSKRGHKIRSLTDLSGKTLAIKSWNGVEEVITQNFPEMKVRSYASSSLLFQAVDNFEADALLMMLPKGLEIIRNRGFSEIELTGQTDYKVGLLVFVRDDWPELVEILNKTIDVLDKAYRPALEKAWYEDLGGVSVENKRFVSLLRGGFIVCILVLCILYYAKRRSDQKALEEKKRSEEAEKKALEEKRRSEEKSRFFASVSHDLRNPLALMVGMLELVDEAEQEGNHQEYIQTALYSSNTLLNLLNQVLDFSQMEAGKMAIYPQAHNLKKLIVKSVKIYQLTQGQSVKFNYKFLNKEVVPEWVLVDELRLQQILSNLVGNALKFTKEGSVDLEVKWLVEPNKHSLWSVADFSSESSPSGYLVLDIHDTGPGMKPDQVEQLFQPYAQESNDGARPKGNGLGLGLSICKDLVELMGGGMRAHSVLGVGSIFSVLIPLQVTELPVMQSSLPVASAPQSRGEGRSKKVLIVDDDAVYRKLVKIQCENLGVHTVVAESGAEALEVMKKEELFCVFMDVEMVGLSGSKTVKIHREYEQSAKKDRTLIIALTGHIQRNEELIDDGFDQVYTKPISKKDLTRVLF